MVLSLLGYDELSLSGQVRMKSLPSGLAGVVCLLELSKHGSIFFFPLKEMDVLFPKTDYE